MFFESDDNMQALTSFLRHSDAAHVEDEVQSTRLSTLREIVSYIYSSPSEWDERCLFNIENIGAMYISYLREFDKSKPANIDQIYSMSYRFLCEYDFLIPAGKELSFKLSSIKNKIQSDAAKMDDDIRSQIVYSSYIMPANIAKDFITDSKIGTIKEFNQTKVEAEDLKRKWDKEIASKESAVEALKSKLEKYEVGFNFVGLYQGFSDLGNKKTGEAFWLFVSLLAMGVAILTPILAAIAFASTSMHEEKILSINHLLVLAPLISLEIILIYFFRILLLNHRSAKAQIMQIELRQTLCQFIQSYAEYSSELRQKDDRALDKFESLIFSGVLSDPEKLPSTFDGIEQIGNLVKSLRN